MSLSSFHRDPRIENNLLSAQIYNMTYEGLTKIEPTGEVILAQAKSFTLSKDKKTYTFYLKKCFWSDGKKITATDYENSYKELLDPRFPSKNAHFFYCIKNALKAKKGLCSSNQIGIKALNEDTLVITLSEPQPFFLHRLSSHTFYPTKKALSNGPFLLIEHLPGNKIVLKKNPFYHLSKDISLEKITIFFHFHETTNVNLFTSKKIHFIGSPFSPFPLDALEFLKKEYPAHFKQVAGTKILAFNCKNFLFQHAQIRKAFCLAFSRASLVKNITQKREAVSKRITPSIFYPTSKNLFFERDIKKAKTLFSSILHYLNIQKEQIPSIRVIYSMNETNHLLAQNLQKVWSEVFDIPIYLEKLDMQQMYYRLQKKNYDIAIYSWFSEFLDPKIFLERLSSKHHFQNPTGWEDTKFSQILKQTSSNNPSSLLNAEKILIEELPIFPLYQWNYFLFYHPFIKNLQISPMGLIYFEKLDIKD